MALHKMIRLVTMATCGNGYLTFMGNEFGHPEWIDFPREGNGWSYKHARRQWSLVEPDYLRYRYLNNFDRAMITLAHQEAILDEKPELFVQDEEKKILIFRRKNCIFALNFNPTESFADYGFAAPAGKYEVVLNTDESEFDGFSRIKTGEEKGKIDKYELLRRTMVMSFDMTIKNLIEENKQIDGDTVESRNYFLRTPNCFR